MTEISDYHRYLFFGKVTNSLSPEEIKELDELFANDPDALASFEELVSSLPASDVQSSYNFLNESNYWKDIIAPYRNTQKTTVRSIMIRRLMAAAVITGILIGGTTLVFNFRHTKTAIPAVIARQDAVELKLANGKKINLSDAKGTIQESGIILTNADKALTYQSAASEINGINSVTVPVGKDYQIVLDDGSKVWMNSITELSFPARFTGNKREITLSGEAYLEISKNTKQPFIVHLPDATVEVTGTSFNINTYDPGIVKVALVDGGVNVLAKDVSANLKPGIQAICDKKSGNITKERFEKNNVLSWQKGVFYFEEAQLSDLSSVLQRWYGITSVIDNDKLKEKKFAGVLDKNKPVETFLRNMKIISKIESYFDGKGILHFK